MVGYFPPINIEGLADMLSTTDASSRSNPNDTTVDRILDASAYRERPLSDLGDTTSVRLCSAPVTQNISSSPSLSP